MKEPSCNTPEMNVVVVRKTGTRNLRGSDEEELRRRRKVGDLYDQMSICLMQRLGRNFTNKVLLQIAGDLAVAHGLFVDRGAKRSKASLICWFCENCVWLLRGTERGPICPEDQEGDAWQRLVTVESPHPPAEEADGWFWG